ncbi:MAG: hypothetical protein WDO13_19185 [Verrucomicrobiota bacterium]
MKSVYWKILLACTILLSGSLALHAQQRFNEIDGTPIHTQADLNGYSTGDIVMLTCATCKTGSMVSYSKDPNDPGHVKWMQAGYTKTCSMCGGKLKAVEKNGKIVYVCSKCGMDGFVTGYKTSKQ